MKKFRSALVVLALGLSGLTTQAAGNDMNALLNDLNQKRLVGNQMTLAFWLPPEYFFATVPNGSAPEQQQFLLGMLDGHLLFLVADGEFSNNGALTAKSRADVLALSRLEINGRPPLSPVPDAELKGDLQNLLTLLKPLFAKMMGNLGEAIEPVVFRAPVGIRTNPLAVQEGRVTFRFGAETFSWRTPLGSLLPPVVDAATGEQFPGNYLYSPYTGRKLTGK